jgi:uncharacterized OsmC-like protein
MDLISIEHKEKGAFKIGVRTHSATSDFNKADGGDDLGPNPTEYMVGALGACIAIMVNNYCKKHGYTDGEVGVSLTYELADNPKRVSAVIADLEIPKDVPEEKKGAIMRIAELCPIHNTLENPLKIDIEIV